MHNQHLETAAREALDNCGVSREGGGQNARTPITGETLFDTPGTLTINEAVDRADVLFLAWKNNPAPMRANVIKALGRLLEDHKEDLATLVQIEVGKIRSEALGEIQEMIDICEFAVGLSRQLHGLTIASERPGHRLAETWHPLGPVGIITAFNFPAAVWAWNAALAVVCGNPVIWKPSELTPMTSHAVNALARRAARSCNAPEDLFGLVSGGRNEGETLAKHTRVPLVSATGSTEMGRSVAVTVAGRFGKSLLELGGNNAAILAPSADMKLAVRAMTFAAAGTAGQRCTTLRRIIVHETRRDELLERMSQAYRSLNVGDPREESTLVGPLINLGALQRMQDTIERHLDEGGELIAGGERVNENSHPGAAYVRPAIVAIEKLTDTARRETFAPLVSVMTYRDIEEAVLLNNDVPQGLASSIFTTDLREAERFLGPNGSDCGITNVNIGPSGAEIGGAFGGEKETGGGRESGSDAWKNYMRRSTSTVNYSNHLPLAQGVVFN